ncbi:Six-hairpin glycosidase-like protein [Xylariaceae sp. FL0594]|nr:Six-hairpin glycosidase-like protein [Xylariaceae sp. FL0594]
MLSPVYLATIAAALFADTGAATVSDKRYQLSKWMASSIISRGQGVFTGTGGSSEALQAGFTQKAFTALVAQYPGRQSADFKEYIQTSAESSVPFLSNATKDALSYPMDRLSNGNALLALSSKRGGSALRATEQALRDSIDLNRRNAEGGLWYFVYPEWSYLDGMYSLAPFYALHSITTAGYHSKSTAAALDDLLYQLDLLWTHTYHADTGLLTHGYDASRKAVWADPNTGASPFVWVRSLGWYTMALVDLLEVLDDAPLKYKKPVLQKFQKLMPAIIKAVDPRTGGWWQIVDQPGRPGNYIESSGSAMFAYSLLKGSRLGYLPLWVAPAARIVALRAYQYLTNTFVVQEADGTLSYNGTVAVCSLNSTASYDYYTHQPILYNSVLGSAAYVLASLEVERL